MDRSLHRLQIKSGVRTLADVSVAVDPGDHQDLTEAVGAILKQKNRNGAKDVRVLVYKGRAYVKEVHLR